MPVPVVETVRTKTDAQCHATTCRDGSCSLSLKDVPEPSILISLEHEAAPVKTNQAHCDYLFVGGSNANRALWVAPVELTASAARVSKFLPQLRAGADIADKLLPQNVQVRFRPVGAYGGELRRTERNGFLKSVNHVVFRRKPVPIKLVRCGSPLTNALRH
jgi:hypothetical protein